MSRLLVNLDKVLLSLFAGGALAFVILLYRDRLPAPGVRPFAGPQPHETWGEGDWPGPVTPDPATPSQAFPRPGDRGRHDAPPVIRP